MVPRRSQKEDAAFEGVCLSAHAPNPGAQPDSVVILGIDLLLLAGSVIVGLSGIPPAVAVLLQPVLVDSACAAVLLPAVGALVVAAVVVEVGLPHFNSSLFIIITVPLLNFHHGVLPQQNDTPRGGS